MYIFLFFFFFRVVHPNWQWRQINVSSLIEEFQWKALSTICFRSHLENASEMTVPSQRFIHINLLRWHSYPTWSRAAMRWNEKVKNQMRQPKIHIRKFQESKISESYWNNKNHNENSMTKCTLHTIHLRSMCISRLSPHTSRIAYRSHFTS